MHCPGMQPISTLCFAVRKRISSFNGLLILPEHLYTSDKLSSSFAPNILLEKLDTSSVRCNSKLNVHQGWLEPLKTMAEETAKARAMGSMMS